MVSVFMFWEDETFFQHATLNRDGVSFTCQLPAIIDLTHPFDTTTIYWPTAPGFELIVDLQFLRKYTLTQDGCLLIDHGESVQLFDTGAPDSFGRGLTGVPGGNP